MKDVTTGRNWEQGVGIRQEQEAGELAGILLGESQGDFFTTFYDLAREKVQQILMQVLEAEVDAIMPYVKRAQLFFWLQWNKNNASTHLESFCRCRDNLGREFRELV